jgi:hypothetical protein
VSPVLGCETPRADSELPKLGTRCAARTEVSLLVVDEDAAIASTATAPTTHALKERLHRRSTACTTRTSSPTVCRRSSLAGCRVLGQWRPGRTPSSDNKGRVFGRTAQYCAETVRFRRMTAYHCFRSAPTRALTITIMALRRSGGALQVGDYRLRDLLIGTAIYWVVAALVLNLIFGWSWLATACAAVLGWAICVPVLLLKEWWRRR